MDEDGLTPDTVEDCGFTTESDGLVPLRGPCKAIGVVADFSCGYWSAGISARIG
jgi:hypothetical protein